MEFKKTFQDFINKKGFYLVLALCMVILVSTVMLVTAYNISPPDSSGSQIAKEHIDDSAAAGSRVAAGVPKTTVTPTSSAYSEAASKEASTKPVVSPTPSVTKDTTPLQKFMMPLRGEITCNFSDDTLIYSKTLDEWRTHPGIDISSPLGAAVKSVADGTVCEVKNDPRFGITVVIQHSDTVKTAYANLASDSMVAVGQVIKQSDVIGSVGNTASLESAEQPHLHFEVLKDDLPQNPSNYLPFKG